MAGLRKSTIRCHSQRFLLDAFESAAQDASLARMDETG
jgi:hypothetical protein